MTLLPTRIHLGTQKAASTYLYNLLKQHPNVALPTQTEVHYYSLNSERGETWYQDLFPKEGVRIETSPKYFMQGAEVAPRIKEALGDEAKLLVVLRNPIDYLYSHFQMQLAQGYFAKASDRYPVPPQDLLMCLQAYPDYLERAQYHHLLVDVWLKYFEQEQVKVVLFERLTHDMQATMNEILDFWELEPCQFTEPTVSMNRMVTNPWLLRLRDWLETQPALKDFLKENAMARRVYTKVTSGANTPKLTADERSKVAEYLRSDVSALRALLNDPLLEWKDFVHE